LGRTGRRSLNGPRSQLAEPRPRMPDSSILRGGLDHRNDAGSNSLGKLVPSVDNGAEIRIALQGNGSAFGSAHGTRTDVCCRTLTEIGPVLVRRNSLAIRGFRRVLTPTAACRRMYRKSGGGGNCTRVPGSVGSGVDVRSRSFVCRPRGCVRQGPFPPRHGGQHDCWQTMIRASGFVRPRHQRVPEMRRVMDRHVIRQSGDREREVADL